MSHLPFLFIMDPIESIHIKKDSTFAVMLSAQKAGYLIYYTKPEHLFLENGHVYANCVSLRLMDNEQHWFEYLGDWQAMSLEKMSIIWMRQDPPVNSCYLYTTQLLDMVEKKGVRIINRPSSVRDCNEKLFAQWFPELCPPTLVTRNKNQIHHFLNEHSRIILKPLDGMGGRGIFYLEKQDKNKNMILDTVTQYGKEWVMAQVFLPEIALGDKRITLIHGRPIDYVVARIPSHEDIRGNLAAGGQAKVMPISDHERWLCDQISATLIEKGLFWVGLDVIGRYITEINVTSPTCLREVENATQVSISDQLIAELSTCWRIRTSSRR